MDYIEKLNNEQKKAATFKDGPCLVIAGAGSGKVIEGMDVIEKIENTEFEIDNEVYGTLKKPLTIEKATVDTKGYTYKVTKK